ncbi:MAG: hypothetical protein JOY72_10250 [Actinobacteria bacterium]|nr:hypothetical protein [Actinomycetota bacterium]
MELAAGITSREEGLDLLAAHLDAFDPDREDARERLDRTIGADLAMLLVTALSRTPEHAVAA